VISPSKVFDVLIAEERFHRRAFRNWGQGNNKR
jgi:rubrerythrin